MTLGKQLKAVATETYNSDSAAHKHLARAENLPGGLQDLKAAGY